MSTTKSNSTLTASNQKEETPSAGKEKNTRKLKPDDSKT